jgi:hypothetical protein
MSNREALTRSQQGCLGLDWLGYYILTGEAVRAIDQRAVFLGTFGRARLLFQGRARPVCVHEEGAQLEIPMSAVPVPVPVSSKDL